MREEYNSKSKNDLETALGKPKYFINTPGLVEGETYAWFPTKGESMTDDSAYSIPSGSLVLGRWLKIKSIEDIPLLRPIVVIVDYGNGQQYCMLKSACGIRCNASLEEHELCLSSYNPAPWFDDFWIPFSTLCWIFVVELVQLPDGREFIPKEEKKNTKR